MIVLINASHPLFSREGFSSHLTKARISVYQRFMQIRVFMPSREGSIRHLPLHEMAVVTCNLHDGACDRYTPVRPQLKDVYGT
jgi:hypothetical protein